MQYQVSEMQVTERSKVESQEVLFQDLMSNSRLETQEILSFRPVEIRLRKMILSVFGSTAPALYKTNNDDNRLRNEWHMSHPFGGSWYIASQYESSIISLLRYLFHLRILV